MSIILIAKLTEKSLKTYQKGRKFNFILNDALLVFFNPADHGGSHREVYRDFQPSLTSSAGGAKGLSDHRFRAPPADTAQLLTLH